MSFGIGESKSTATDNRIAATDQAQVAKNSTFQSPFNKAKVNTGIQNSKVNANTGIQITTGKLAKGSIINVGDTTGAGAAAAAAAVSDVSQKFADTVEATGKQDLVSNILNTLKGVSQNATEQTLTSKIQPTTINLGSGTGSDAINSAIASAAGQKPQQPSALSSSTTGYKWVWWLVAAIVGLVLFKKLK